MVSTTGPAQWSTRCLALTALAFDFAAIVSLFVADALGNAGFNAGNDDFRTTIAYLIVLFCPGIAGIFGLVLAILAVRRARGWGMLLAVTSVLVNIVLLLLAAVIWSQVLQSGG